VVDLMMVNMSAAGWPGVDLAMVVSGLWHGVQWKELSKSNVYIASEGSLSIFDNSHPSHLAHTPRAKHGPPPLPTTIAVSLSISLTQPHM
jgi:hypothetical protein